MKKLIFRNLLKDVSNFFIVAAISISIIIWVVQAVNYLDFVAEDGHSFKVYFMYTLLSLPKIVSRILPFIFFVSIFYIVIKYEENNQLIIFWLNGIKKITFVNVLIKYSLIFLLIQTLLTTFIVPQTQDSARSFIRSSTIDLFPSLIQERKFIDTVSNLTIYVDKKNKNGLLENIFLKDQLNGNQSQTIYAKEGRIVNKENKNYLVLKKGKIINKDNKNVSTFSFQLTQFNLSKYGTKTTVFPKVQEQSTYTLANCLYLYYINKKDLYLNKFLDCDSKSVSHIMREFFRRIFLPFYIPLIALIVGSIILTSKDNISYNRSKLKIFILTIFIIIISEISVRYFAQNNLSSILLILMPIVFFFTTYLIINRKFKYISK
jgi:lipopolysaccharide export system permease protein